MGIPEALIDTLISPNVTDANFEPANVVDVINHLSNNTRKIADAIKSPGVCGGGSDATGGHVESLIEAVMGMTQGLMAIADAINGLSNQLGS